MSGSDDEGPRLEGRFEGRAALDKALERAGSFADTEDVADAFKKAIADGVPRPVVVDALFEEEPRFESPAHARALYENLFGLWELLESGGDLKAPPPPRTPKPTPTTAPAPFGDEGPDDAWMEGAWRYLESAPKTQKTKWQDAFDNRADALNTWLLEQGLSDEAHDTAQSIFFEAFCLLELGGGAGAVPSALVAGGAVPSEPVPAPLWSWAEECLFEAAEDEAAPIPEAEAAALAAAVKRGLEVLWAQARLTKRSAAK